MTLLLSSLAFLALTVFSVGTYGATKDPLCSLPGNQQPLQKEQTRRIRKEEAVRTVQELNSKIMNALDKLLLTNGSSDPRFCSLLNYVLDHQYDKERMDIRIEDFYFCNPCEFYNIWNKLASLFAYRKRHITDYVLLNYSDVDCVRRVTVYGVGAHFGSVNWLDTDPLDPEFPGLPWRKTKDFWDTDRFQIEYVEREEEPGTFGVNWVVQFTEEGFNLGNDVLSKLSELRSPLEEGAPGDLPLPLPSRDCPLDCPPFSFEHFSQPCDRAVP